MISVPQPDPLSDEVLAKQLTLPEKPEPVVLTGKYVHLELYNAERDCSILYAISNGTPIHIGDRLLMLTILMMSYGGGCMEVLSISESAFADYMQSKLDSPNGIPFTVFDLRLNHQVGVANYLASIPEHLKVELGSIWYSPIAQGTGVNLEATYLMLGHAFNLGYQRVEWKCNALNERSRRSALKMGFQFEGIQDAHYIIKGRRRDTAWFRMLLDEWAEKKLHLESMIALIL